MFAFIKQFVSVYVLGIMFPSLNENNNSKIVPEVALIPKPPKFIWNKPDLFAYTSL